MAAIVRNTSFGRGNKPMTAGLANSTATAAPISRATSHSALRPIQEIAPDIAAPVTGRNTSAVSSEALSTMITMIGR